jgi:prophage tail gpP-like protein
MTELLINNKRFSAFSSYSVSLKYNAVASSFSFTGLENFLPPFLSYPRCQIVKDNEVIITGTVINQTKTESSSPTLLSLSGYSLPGILEDISIPLKLYPLQSDNRTLRDITERLLSPFNVDFIVEADAEKLVDKKYKKTTADKGQSIKAYINKLASQRDIVITHDSLGRVVFTKNTLKPQSLKISNIVQQTLTLPGQALHSEISVVRQASDNPDQGEATVENNLVKQYRPKVKELSDGDIFDVQEAAKNELKSELLQIKLSITTKNFIKPGNIIENIIEGIDIREWFVEQTDITGTITGEIYNLSCVPAAAYYD